MDARRKRGAGAALLVGCLAGLWQLNGRHIKGMTRVPIRWVEIAKGPPHGADM